MRIKAEFGEMLEILLRDYPASDWTTNFKPFEVLIAVILSQNTNDRNVEMAIKLLEREMEITSENVAKASIRTLERCINPAGLQRIKAGRIRGVARRLLNEYNGRLEEILDLPPEEARVELMEFKGIGDKTADVVLNFLGGWDTIPVDTHITRVSKRLEIVGEKAGYAEIKTALEQLIPEGMRRKAHLSMIQFGRRMCRARDPMCPVCSLKDYCNWWRDKDLPSWRKLRAGQ
ncbi:MAG: endonuclease III domain-containing protein [Candidatus Hydrothermarchaeaceae archaeon]